MDKRTIRKSINQFLQKLVGKVQVDKVYIFGSQGSGLALDDSDIDILVVSENFKSMNEDQRLDILYKASRFIRPEIHPWGITSKELESASKLTTIGNIKSTGISYL